MNKHRSNMDCIGHQSYKEFHKDETIFKRQVADEVLK